MQIDTIWGNPDIKSTLQRELSAGTLPHAIVLSAPTGCGRGFVARAIAADYLFPNNASAAAAVTECRSSEFIVVQGEGKSGQISVDSIRAMRQDIYRSSLSANGRVVWIKDAHKMAAPSFNALLKVLEEPPKGVIFILTTGDAAALPETILSRCTIYSLQAVSDADCENALEHCLQEEHLTDKSLPNLLTKLYDGRIGLGLRALQNPERLLIVKDAINLANFAVQKNRYKLLQLFTTYESRADGDREKREDLLADTTAVLETGLRGISVSGAFAFSPAEVVPLLPSILQARQDLRRNVAPKIVFSALSIHLLRA